MTPYPGPCPLPCGCSVSPGSLGQPVVAVSPACPVRGVITTSGPATPRPGSDFGVIGETVGVCPECGAALVEVVYQRPDEQGGTLVVWECEAAQGFAPTCGYRRVYRS